MPVVITTETVAVVMVLGAIYCLGGLHGLWLAWSQETRMRKWADRVAVLSERLYEAEQKGKQS